MRIPKLLSVLSFAALAAGAAALAPADDDTCQDVKFEFTNNHRFGKKIKVVKVQYRNVPNGTTPVVDVADVECAQGATCQTAGRDLRDIEGDNLTAVRFHYQYWEADKQWSTTTVSDLFEPNHKECRAHKTYGLFTIVK